MGIALGANASAGTATGALPVTVTVVSSCAIRSVGPLPVGAYGASLEGGRLVSVACGQSAAAAIEVGPVVSRATARRDPAVDTGHVLVTITF